MSVRQGLAVNTNDPFSMAQNFKERMQRKEERWVKLNVAIDKFQRRIAEVFASLSKTMRLAVWGRGGA